MIKNKMRKTLGLGALATTVAVGNAEAQSQEALLKALVSKGVLTEAEADALRQEAMQQPAGSMPKWVESISFKGDLRLRYDHTHDSASNGRSAEDRFRYRFRYGATADLRNNFKVGFRFATGSDATSSNQTFSGDFTRDNLGLDQAYGSWSGEALTFYGGKNPNFEKTGWKLSKALFDSDISPEGFEAHYKTEMGDTTIGLHGGVYFMEGEDDSSKSMSKLIMSQVTTSTPLSDTLGMDLGFGVYGMDSSDLTGAGTGHGNTAGQGYTPLMLDVAFNYKGASKPIKLYSTWVNNQQADDYENGLIGGIKFGSVKKAGEWEAKIEYRSIEADAIWDELASSDFGAIGVKAANEYKGGTNTKGFIIQGKYNIYSNVQAALTWTHSEAETSTYDDESNNRVQLDLIFKF